MTDVRLNMPEWLRVENIVGRSLLRNYSTYLYVARNCLNWKRTSVLSWDNISLKTFGGNG